MSFTSLERRNQAERSLICNEGTCASVEPTNGQLEVIEKVRISSGPRWVDEKAF